MHFNPEEFTCSSRHSNFRETWVVPDALDSHARVTRIILLPHNISTLSKRCFAWTTAQHWLRPRAQQGFFRPTQHVWWTCDINLCTNNAIEVAQLTTGHSCCNVVPTFDTFDSDLAPSVVIVDLQVAGIRVWAVADQPQRARHHTSCGAGQSRTHIHDACPGTQEKCLTKQIDYALHACSAWLTRLTKCNDVAV